MRWRILKLDWSYAVGELLIVTAGVLIALGLNQWINDRQLDVEETRLLQSLQQEFQENITKLDREMAYRKAMTASINHLFAASQVQGIEGTRSLDSLLGDMLWWSNAEFATGAVESILIGGKLTIIENPEIRRFLAGWPDQLDSVKETEMQDYETFKNVLMPFMYENSNVPQIANTLSTRPGTMREQSSWSFPVDEQKDHSELLKNPEFLAILVHRSFDQFDVIYRYEELRPQMTRFVKQLDSELRHR